MGFYCGGEYIQDSRELEPPDDAGICYDPECSGEFDNCENCGKYIGAEMFYRFNGFCEDCHQKLVWL